MSMLLKLSVRSAGSEFQTVGVAWQCGEHGPSIMVMWSRHRSMCSYWFACQ